MRGAGKADVFVMLVHPVGRTKSPGIFKEIFEQAGLDSLMVPLSCRPADFETFWAGISAAGIIRGRLMAAAGRGAILNVGSLASFAPLSLPAYTPGKHAVRAPTEMLSGELGPQGVR